jgi:predicted nuclease with TOPRIM domain
VLRSEYDQIKENDTELAARVQQMSQEDQAILAEFEEVQGDLAALSRRAPQVEGDELKLEDRRQRAEKRATDLILRIKRQQAGIATWLHEALNRDRGPVD